MLLDSDGQAWDHLEAWICRHNCRTSNSVGGTVAGPFVLWFSHHFSSYVVREASPGFSFSNEEVASPSDPKPLSLTRCGSHQGIPERFTSEQLFLTQRS